MASQTSTTPTNATPSATGVTAGAGAPGVLGTATASEQHVSSTWPLSPHYYYNSSVVNPTNDLSKNPLLNRIGLEPVKRILLITASASFWGFMLGGVIGSRQSGMQYLAENAHRLPKNMEGWYFYHKRKNYRMMWGAFQKGVVFSSKTGAMVGLFEVLEASMDFYRGGADLFNSMMAGVASGAFFAAINKLPRQSSKHTLMLGAGYGLVSGGLQDLSSYLKGTPVWYLPQSLKERSLALKLPEPEE
ncbi:hypothetical protein BGZ95_009140 [Linnemannia exigua]|uniref:Mitochondrial import inner membrane translocase subunit TIM22 n=1 Tax=Linnemannia exigua TaxID=604196 RepID=A0AAD4DDN9_9FUNG|nr:hypothetical protein BGZ95_009140 [Linnemannia exigua]